MIYKCYSEEGDKGFNYFANRSKNIEVFLSFTKAYSSHLVQGCRYSQAWGATEKISIVVEGGVMGNQQGERREGKFAAPPKK